MILPFFDAILRAVRPRNAPWQVCVGVGKMRLARNISRDERMTRFLIGGILLGCYAFGVTGSWSLIGVGFIATSWLNFCLIYRLIGIKTCTDC